MLSFVLRNCKGFKNMFTFTIIYYSLGGSKLEYGAIIYYTLYKIDSVDGGSTQWKLLKCLYLLYLSRKTFPIL